MGDGKLIMRRRSWYGLLPFSACFAISPAYSAAGDVIAGTAFLYNEHGDMFTNRHVVEQCDPARIVVRTSDDRVSKATVIALSEQSDLAALSTEIKQDAFASLRATEDGYVSLPGQIEDVFTAGYSQPFKNAFKIQLKWGQIQGFVDANGKPAKSSSENFARMNVDQGASGSAVLDYSGLLVGIVYSRSVRAVRDPEQLAKSGYGDKLVRLYNNDAIVTFAKQNSLRLNSWSKGTRKDPVFIVSHLDRITALVVCMAAGA